MEDVLATLEVVVRHRGVRNGLPEASWGFLGARLASGGHFGRLWAEKGEPKNCMAGSWDRLGALLAALGPDLGRLPAPGRTPREPRGGHFWSFFQRYSREPYK